jgi:hypothetical protein
VREDVELVMKAGSFEIKVDRNHTFPQTGKVARGVGE